jgi:hypothetical protein
VANTHDAHVCWITSRLPSLPSPLASAPRASQFLAMNLGSISPGETPAVAQATMVRDEKKDFGSSTDLRYIGGAQKWKLKNATLHNRTSGSHSIRKKKAPVQPHM